jgi:hypothetical protein
MSSISTDGGHRFGVQALSISPTSLKRAEVRKLFHRCVIIPSIKRPKSYLILCESLTLYMLQPPRLKAWPE